MTMTLDRRRPFVRVKDFVSGNVTLEQDGKKFSESGHLLVLPERAFKYGCPKCEYHTDQGGLLLAHASKVHRVSDEMVECFKTMIQNIDRGLLPDEGIDWHQVKVVRSAAQLAIDEQDKLAREQAPKAHTRPLPVGPMTCPHCPRQFKNLEALNGHMKFHRGQEEKK